MSSPNNSEEDITTPSKYAVVSSEGETASNTAGETPGVPLAAKSPNAPMNRRGSKSLDSMLDLDHLEETMVNRKSRKKKYGISWTKRNQVKVQQVLLFLLCF